MASETVMNGTHANGKASKKRKHRAEQDEVADGETKKPSREERREAKRLKKLAKEDAPPMKNSSEAALVEDVTDVDPKAAKGKRKEEKKKRKRGEKALQSQKVVESETARALTTNGDASTAESDERGAMNEDRMQMIEKAEAREYGTVEDKKIARTEKNARNKQKKKAKKAERIQGAEPIKGVEPDSQAHVAPSSKVKEPSHAEDFVSIQPTGKNREGENAFLETTDSVREERKKREKAEKRNARRAALEAESAKGVIEVVESTKVATDEDLSEERRQRKEEARKVAKKLEPNATPADSNTSIEPNVNGELKREREQRKQEAIVEIEKLERRKPKAKEAQTEKANGTLSGPPQVDGSGEASDPAIGYVEDPALQALPQATIDDFLSSKNITIRDLATDKAPSQRPIIDFKYLPMIPGLSSSESPFATFKAPTPIQAAAWPHLLSSRDVVGVAETGSGKTLAFGVPCIQHITSLPQSLPSESPIRAVIVSPTRELASQIHTQIIALAEPASLNAVCLYGGIPKHQQRADLKNAHIIIATPGRLNDLIEEGHADLSRVTYLVLDEADRMLDKGFEEAITTIISRTPPIGRQTAMFTATWPASVRELAATFMTDPIRITISSSINGEANPTGELRANPNITQQVEVMDPHWKEGRLRELVKALSPPSENTSRKQSSMVNKAYPIKMQQNRVLIFCLYKKEADRIEKMLRKAMAGSEIRIAAIHGDMSQPLRTASLSGFKNGEVSVLVATDVAARGLDIPDVKAVINFTFPLTVEDYVHRIGRTGRAGKDGLAVTFFTDLDKHLAGGLSNVLKGAGQEVPEELLKYGTTVKKKTHEAYGNFYREVREGEKKEGTMTRLS